MDLHPSLFNKKRSSQTGAMFGLDARIAMAIFAVLTATAAATATFTINRISAGSLVHELSQYEEAIGGIHKDLREDLHKSLRSYGTAGADIDAIKSLYDRDVLKKSGRWVGPYIDRHSTHHSKYGEMRLSKRQATYKDLCIPYELCYLWIRLESVPMNTALKVDEEFDGQTAEDLYVNGRVQLEGDGDYTTLWYRVSKALSYN